MEFDAAKKRCFVICPIGDEGSSVRKRSDDVLKLLLEPALEKHAFDVIRADRMVGGGQINAEVIELVQNAELCIVDLTGQNPNVYYECGRRHETGKPVIQIMEKGSTILFDLAGYRTLEYDISSSWSTHDSIQEIRRHLDALAEAGFTSTSGVSMGTLAQAIDRIERQLDRLGGGGHGSLPAAPGQVPIQTLRDIMRNPQEAFVGAVATGDIAGAVTAFSQLRRIVQDPTKLVALAGMLADVGVAEGAMTLRELLSDRSALRFDGQEFTAGLSALARYYALTDTETEGIGVILPIAEARLQVELDPKTKSRINNYVQMMYYGAHQYEEALRYGMAAIALDPENVSFKFNVSLIYEAMDRLPEAERLVDEYMARGEKVDSDHLSQAIDIYLKVGRRGDARAAYEKLAAVDAQKAAVKLLLDEALRAVVHGGTP